MHLFRWLSLILLFILPARAQEFLPPEQAFAFSAQMNGAQSVRVSFKIADGYYMYRDEFKFSVVSPDGAVSQTGAVKLPAAQIKFDENFNQDMAIYHKQVSVDVPIQKKQAGEALFKVVVTSRGCADKGLCYPPRQTQAVLKISDVAAPKPVETPAEVVKPEVDKTEVAPQSPAPKAAAPASVQPLLPAAAAPPSIDAVKTHAAAFDNSSDATNILSQRHWAYALLAMFGLGVLLSLTPCMLPMLPVLSAMLAGQRNVSRGRGFLLALSYVTGMAAVYALIGVLVAHTGSGLHQYLQSPWVLGGLAGLMVVLALSMFGLFQLQLPVAWQTWLSQRTQGQHGYVGGLVLGAGSALIASPCVTAPLVGILTYISQTGHAAFGGLALLVLAYGMGVPLLLLGAGFGQLVPKSGAWMLRIKTIIGVLMLAAAVWIAQPLWSKYVPKNSAELAFQPIHTVAELDNALAQSNQPILLDVYADWCRSCIEMERKTFSEPRVRQAMSEMTLLRVDMTDYTEAHAALLQRLNLYGPPAVVRFAPNTAREQLRVVGFEAADVFLGRLRPLP
ncbi:MAG: protein-disulfide reductase DsbD [Formosimonas sp.]